jgi:hypothetical protein
VRGMAGRTRTHHQSRQRPQRFAGVHRGRCRLWSDRRCCRGHDRPRSHVHRSSRTGVRCHVQDAPPLDRVRTASGRVRQARKACPAGRYRPRGRRVRTRTRTRFPRAGQAGQVSAALPIASVSPAARSQLEAIRDEWLRPLIDELNVKSEEIGRLKAERDAAVKTSDALREENAFLRAVQRQASGATAGHGEAIEIRPTSDTSESIAPQRPVQRSWWRFWER